VDEAEPVGESFGEPKAVEGEDSAVTWRLVTGLWLSAVVLILAVGEREKAAACRFEEVGEIRTSNGVSDESLSRSVIASWSC
jgi:hypothetical protein